MQIRLSKGSDKPTTLRCLRDDGTETWTALKSITPHHDLMHYAVETTLNYRGAFYGLIAQGWNIEDFTTRLPDGSFRAMPPEAMAAETLVILLQGEQVSGGEQTDLLALVAAACAAHHVLPPQFTPEQVTRIRERFRGYWKQWQQLPPGETLELAFP